MFVLTSHHIKGQYIYTNYIQNNLIIKNSPLFNHRHSNFFSCDCFDRSQEITQQMVFHTLEFQTEGGFCALSKLPASSEFTDQEAFIKSGSHFPKRLVSFVYLNKSSL